jgi:hypothetical protein
MPSCRVPLGRVVAAADVAAFEADPQVKPGLAGRQAFFAAGDGIGERGDLDLLAVLAEDHALRACPRSRVQASHECARCRRLPPRA